MIYTANITVPKGRPVTNRYLERLLVTKGLVYKVEIDFPPGPQGTTHIVINDGGFQLWPTTPESTFASDARLISFDDCYIKNAAPFEFQIYGYNEDTVNAHTVQVRIGMVSQRIFMARFLPTYVQEDAQKLLREAEQKEVEMRRDAIENIFQ